MVTYGLYKMMPMAPASAMAIPPSSKPKIGFSIDSIVGNSALHNLESSLSPHSESSERPSSPLSDCSYPLELRNNEFSRNIRLSDNRMQLGKFHRNFSIKFSESLENSQNGSLQKHNNNLPIHHNRLSPADDPGRPPRSPSPPLAHHQQPSSKGPIVVPGIPASLIRPYPVQAQNVGEMKTMPPYINSSEVVNTPNPHFLAAQFQMAAALAHGQSGQGFPNSGLPQHHPQFGSPNMVRDSYPLYPWLLSRHGRIFPHRFPGMTACYWGTGVHNNKNLAAVKPHQSAYHN